MSAISLKACASLALILPQTANYYLLAVNKNRMNKATENHALQVAFRNAQDIKWAKPTKFVQFLINNAYRSVGRSVVLCVYFQVNWNRLITCRLICDFFFSDRTPSLKLNSILPLAQFFLFSFGWWRNFDIKNWNYANLFSMIWQNCYDLKNSILNYCLKIFQFLNQFQTATTKLRRIWIWAITWMKTG